MQPRTLAPAHEVLTTRARSSPLRAGADIGGGLKLELRLGAGAHSETWRACGPSGVPVAVKFPTAASAAAIRREHRLLSRLRHSSIVAAHGFVRAGRRPGLVLEYLGGGDLVSLRGAPPARWLRAARDVTAALEHIHRAGFVHGDVAARNVLFDRDDRARLIDFSSVAASGARAGPGTAAYRRPAASAFADVRDDVHAWAAVLYELWAGRLPFGVEPPASAADRPRLLPLPERPPALDGLAGLIESTLAEPAGGGRGLSAFKNVLESVALRYE